VIISSNAKDVAPHFFLHLNTMQKAMQEACDIEENIPKVVSKRKNRVKGRGRWNAQNKGVKARSERCRSKTVHVIIFRSAPCPSQRLGGCRRHPDRHSATQVEPIGEGHSESTDGKNGGLFNFGD
jgi:hypothetical protein